ncbi:MAG TPA: 50S ribosomal protein L25 [Saprospiraceae bacterium]|nr:50S ribosomal protein L25 [Saprospiraceae bacterium]
MEIVAVSGKLRKEVGKKASAKVRAEGLIPCVMYDAEQVIHFSADFKDVKKLIYTPKFKLAELTIDGKTHKCILKDYQMHPVTDEVTHIDFLHLVEGNPVKIEVPIQFTGSSPGVKSGGKLQRLVRRVKIKVYPNYIIDKVVLDVSSLEMGQSIRIRDIDPIEGVEVMTSPGVPVAIVDVPRAMRSAQTAAAKEGAEGLPEDAEEGEEEVEEGEEA